MQPSGRNLGRLEDHPEYTLLPFTPTGPPPKITSRNHRSQIFYFSPKAFCALKAEANPANARQRVSVQTNGFRPTTRYQPCFGVPLWPCNSRSNVALEVPVPGTLESSRDSKGRSISSSGFDPASPVGMSGRVYLPAPPLRSLFRCFVRRFVLGNPHMDRGVGVLLTFTAAYVRWTRTSLVRYVVWCRCAPSVMLVSIAMSRPMSPMAVSGLSGASCRIAGSI